MRHCLYAIILLLIVSSCSEKNRTFLASEVSILPKPTKLILAEQSFALKNGMAISIENNDQELAAKQLIEILDETTGYKLDIADKNNQAAISFVEVKGMSPESYVLSVTPKQITIKASDAAGYFYGIQSVHQLISAETGKDSTKIEKWLVPCVTVEDAPRFKWRAYLLDEARFFQGEAFVKQILDQMAVLKMNIFHWHLTDDSGWRIEIKKYPKLTEIGSKRLDSEIGTWGSGKLAGEPHSGFYTQDQIKDIVAYAAERHITIVPEFEMPGHASAAIAAYTWLGTAGKDIDVPILFGRHYDNYDVTKPEVVQFLKDVLTEVFELFPSKVIHIGGDEVGYKVWEESKHVQKYMKQNGINSPADLQISFTNTISKFIEQNGRRMMGWNEIMGINIHDDFEEKKDDKQAETELAKNVVVHFWKGNLDLATQAAEKGYGIVNSIFSSTYLDYTYDYISLEKAYSFNPIPEGLKEEYHANVYGLGCQMWGEWTPTTKEVEYQTYPRIAAYAEVGWTALENKDYDSFKIALRKLQKRWDVLGINYAKVIDN